MTPSGGTGEDCHMERGGCRYHGSYQMWPARLADHCEKSVRAPPRAQKAYQVATTDLSMEALAETVMGEIFKRQTSLEGDLMRFSAGQ